jgi:hypothetical protein
MEETARQYNQQSLQDFLDVQKHIWKTLGTETKGVAI